jgi:hypothetical protein
MLRLTREVSDVARESEPFASRVKMRRGETYQLRICRLVFRAVRWTESCERCSRMDSLQRLNFNVAIAFFAEAVSVLHMLSFVLRKVSK